MDILKQPQYMSVVYVYDENFKALVNVNKIDPFLVAQLKPEHYEDWKCNCGCGQTHQVVTKETMEGIIAKLAAKRIAELN